MNPGAPIPKCASCIEFDVDAAVDNGGRATCTGWGTEKTWDTSAGGCVFYGEVSAAERARRRPIVRMMAAQQKEK